VCVCEREREREKEKMGSFTFSQIKSFQGIFELVSVFVCTVSVSVHCNEGGVGVSGSFDTDVNVEKQKHHTQPYCVHAHITFTHMLHIIMYRWKQTLFVM